MKIKILVLSNIFFILPLILAIIGKMYPYSIILSTATLTSFIFHILKEKRSWLYFDMFFAWILMISNVILIIKSNFNFPYSFIAFVFAGLAIFCHSKQSKKEYAFYHSLWHVLSAFVCLFCVLAFVY